VITARNRPFLPNIKEKEVRITWRITYYWRRTRAVETREGKW